MQARVGPITGPADVEKAKQLLAGFKVTPLPQFLEGQIGAKAIVSLILGLVGSAAAVALFAPYMYAHR